jgi:type II secretory pathway pseudopilin PulG
LRLQRGYTIIETGVYLAVFFVLSGAAYMAMYRGIDRSLGLRRNAEAISSTLQAGEHWRGDIRKATGPIEIHSDSAIRIPTSQGEINYRFETNSIWRRANSNAWMEFLAGVKTSLVTTDTRDQVTAYRWELELLPVKKDLNNTNRFHPLFTFIAVPEQKANP